MPGDLFSVAHWRDYVAALWFFAAWGIYGRAADNYKNADRPSLLTEMHALRIRWLTQMQGRVLRMPDVLILNIATSNYTFFASTSILIIAGGFTLLIGGGKWEAFLSQLPFVDLPSAAFTPIKLLALTLVFVYSFFKFTWSIRQVGYCAIVIGGIPNRYPLEGEHPPDAEWQTRARERAEATAPLFTLAGNNFNQGLRAYYFGLALLPWFITPWGLVISSALIVLVLWRREFHSKTLRMLLRAADAYETEDRG